MLEVSRWWPRTKSESRPRGYLAVLEPRPNESWRWDLIAACRVVFKPQRIAEGEWQIEAHYPGAEVRYIKGTTSKADADDWLQGSRKIDC